MTVNEFRNLKKGELVVYKGNKANKNTVQTRNKCTGLVLEVDEFVDTTDSYGNVKKALRLVQPFVKSDFEMFVSGWGSLQHYK